MSETKVWNLGEIDAPTTAPEASPARPRPSAAPGRPRMAPLAHTPVASSAGELVPGSLSLFVPGSGQLLLGEPALALFFLSAGGLLGALCWAVLDSLERVRSTAYLLGWPPELGVWTLGGIYVAALSLHLGAIASAARPAQGRGLDAHPVFPAFASLLLPGWGQLLNGHRWRAMAFLGGLWTVAAAWLLVSPPAVSLLESQGLLLPRGLQLFSSPAVRWTAPAVIWTLAVYDGFAGALRRRAR